MKTAARISGPVLAFGVVSLILTLLIGWYGWQRQAARQNSPPADPPVGMAVTEPATAPEAEIALNEITPVRSFPDGIPPVIPISLVPHLIAAENISWLKDAEYLLVPRGTQHFGGIEFHLEGLLQLQGRGSESRKRSYRPQISIPLAVTSRAGFPGAIKPELRNGKREESGEVPPECAPSSGAATHTNQSRGTFSNAAHALLLWPRTATLRSLRNPASEFEVVRLQLD